MNRLRTAVIGAGHLGRIHARLAAANPNLHLIGVADPDPHSLAKLDEAIDCTIVADYRSLLSDIDAAIVATPTRCHFDVARTLLEHRLHTFIEKPITTDTREADQLIAAAVRNQVILQVGHVERFNPVYKRAVAQLGEPKYIEAHRTSGYTFRSTDIGAVLDIMIHDLDLILDWVDSEVVEVQAMGIAVLGDHEDMAQAHLEFANGCVAHLTASRISPTQQRTMSIWGLDRFVNVDFANGRLNCVGIDQEHLSECQPLDGLDEERKQHLRDHLFETLLVEENIEMPAANQIDDELTEFAGNASHGKRPTASGSDGRDAVHVAQLVLAAIKRHRWDGTSHGRIGPYAEYEAPVLASPFLTGRDLRQAG